MGAQDNLVSLCRQYHAYGFDNLAKGLPRYGVGGNACCPRLFLGEDNRPGYFREHFFCGMGGHMLIIEDVKIADFDGYLYPVVSIHEINLAAPAEPALRLKLLNTRPQGYTGALNAGSFPALHPQGYLFPGKGLEIIKPGDVHKDGRCLALNQGLTLGKDLMCPAVGCQQEQGVLMIVSMSVCGAENTVAVGVPVPGLRIRAG
jgi:hypothetical protein